MKTPTRKHRTKGTIFNPIDIGADQVCAFRDAHGERILIKQTRNGNDQLDGGVEVQFPRSGSHIMIRPVDAHNVQLKPFHHSVIMSADLPQAQASYIEHLVTTHPLVEAQSKKARPTLSEPVGLWRSIYRALLTTWQSNGGV